MADTKLLPCPFCGEANIYPWNDGTEWPKHKVLCPDCGTEGPEARSESEAIAVWNTRVLTPKEVEDEMAKALQMAWRCLGSFYDGSEDNRHNPIMQDTGKALAAARAALSKAGQL